MTTIASWGKFYRCLQKVVSVQLTDKDTIRRTPILINTARCSIIQDLAMRVLPIPSGHCLLALQQHLDLPRSSPSAVSTSQYHICCLDPLYLLSSYKFAEYKPLALSTINRKVGQTATSAKAPTQRDIFATITDGKMKG